jgi:hypothetical protein
MMTLLPIVPTPGVNGAMVDPDLLATLLALK